VKLLIHRSGAFGDCLIITPILRYLHNKGHEIVLRCNERGAQIFKNNPHIKTLIEEPTDSVKVDILGDHLEWLRKKYKCEKLIDFSESIEVALSQHPRSPNYKLPKNERFKLFNRNFYEFTFEWAKEDWQGRDLKPELFLEESEIEEARKYLKKEAFNILIGMSGSGTNKTWPHTEELCARILDQIPNAHIITVGDARAQMIEPQMERITNLSGKTPMRISMALTGVVNLVISPDTGLLHASGCYPTPKIGILGHNTIECITKHFENDYSVESDPSLAECSPCFFLVYNKGLQCPLNDDYGGASLCMADGIPCKRVLSQVLNVYSRKN